MQRVLRASDSSLVFSLLLVAEISVSVTISCDEDVREVDEEEEPVDKPSTTSGTRHTFTRDEISVYHEHPSWDIKSVLTTSLEEKEATEHRKH